MRSGRQQAARVWKGAAGPGGRQCVGELGCRVPSSWAVDVTLLQPPAALCSCAAVVPTLPRCATLHPGRSINVTADLIEVSLNAEGESGANLPGWDRLMGINSFSIERAQQVCGCGALLGAVSADPACRLQESVGLPSVHAAAPHPAHTESKS